MKTGERSFLHPCDEHYKQLVIQERRKKGGVKGLQGKPSSSGQMNYAKSLAMQQQMIQPTQPKVIPVDPLVKMQQEKELKKLEDQKKKEF